MSTPSRSQFVTCLPFLLLAVAGLPRASADDGAELRSRLKDLHAEGTDLWIYNDIGQAMAEARRQNKPLMVTFRCIPCKDCAGFDAEVAQGSDVIAKLAREKFIPVRQVEMKGVDLSLFQFDHDLNWAAMFVNADGVVYARYGTQSAKGPDAYNSIEGLEKTMQRVLELHAAYPQNADALAGKRSAKKPYRTALDMPGLLNREKLGRPTERGNCIHWHNIHDAENLHAYATKSFTRDMLWRYPLPDNVGLSIDAKDGLRVARVEDGSPAQQAGIRPGEEVTHMGGQPVTSIADMQWALHHAPNGEATLQVRTSRSGEHTLALNAGWKESDISWRGSMWSISPKLRTWMPELPAAKRDELNIPADQKPLEVRWINRQEPGGKAAWDSGLREGDIVVAVDGEPLDFTPQQFNVHVKLHYKVGQKLPLTVLRNGRRLEVPVELVE